MKKKSKKKATQSWSIMLLTMLLMVIMVLVGCAKSETQSAIPDCVVSNSSNDEYSLIIIANQEKIENKEEFARQLIEQVRNNEFKTIMFSFDETGYPTRLEITVYLNEKDWKSHNEPYMNVSFKQNSILDGYNIVEHYDRFHLEINQS